MLQGSPSQRLSAKDLCARLTSILESCREKPEFDALPDVQKALNQVQTENECLHARDVPEPSSQKAGPIQGRAARDARKSYNVHMARMRSEYFGVPAIKSSLWPSASLELSKSHAAQDRVLADTAINQAAMSDSSHASTSRPGGHGQGAGTSLQKPPPNAQIKRTSTTNQRKPQDVFQARHELEELAAEQKRGISKKLKGMVTSDRKKDPFLADFFKSRDIVSLLLRRCFPEEGADYNLRSSLQTMRAAWLIRGRKQLICSTYLCGRQRISTTTEWTCISHIQTANPTQFSSGKRMGRPQGLPLSREWMARMTSPSSKRP